MGVKCLLQDQVYDYITASELSGVGVNVATEPKEWVSPPMQPNVEYRTTERYLGKPVYQMAIQTGNLPSGSGLENRIMVTPPINGYICNIFDYKITYREPTDSFVYHDPMITNGATVMAWTYLAWDNSTLPSFLIEANGDHSEFTGVIVFKYTKTTD